MKARGMLEADELAKEIGAGAIDTVLVAFPDLQGRLVGKRVTGSYWREHMGAGTEPLHMCNYLLAVDSEMNVLPGYAFASWDQGYGDMAAQPDLATIRTIPWLEKTALVLCDLLDEETGAPVEVSPRRILQRQVEHAAAAGFTLNFASELEFFVFRDSLEEAAAKDYTNLTPHSLVVEDYHILQTTRDEYLIRDIRNGIDGAGVPVEFSKGEAGKGQHEINLLYADAVEMADRHVIYKNGVKEIAAQHNRAVTFMAKFSSDEVGSSCHVHSSLWSLDGKKAMFDDHHGPHGMSETFQHYLAGLIATAQEFSLLWAPTVNSYKRFQPGSWAPTGIGWGVDNRTLGFRKVGHGQGCRVECRIPGSDANSYFAFAGQIAGGLYGIKNELPLEEPFVGNGYEATGIGRIPWNLPDAIAVWEGSEIAKECFGDEVHHHILTMAKGEWLASNQSVTDWELRRYWERI